MDPDYQGGVPMERELDEYERAVVSIFEHCGFTYDPGPPRGPEEVYAEEVQPIPHAEFSQKVLPAYWMRSVALHLGDARGACEEVNEYLRQMPAFLARGTEGVGADWRDMYLPVPVSDELRFHVFCFLTLSEEIRDKIRATEEGAGFLVPNASARRPRSRVPVQALSRSLVERHGLDEARAIWVAQQLSRLEAHCTRTRDAIDTLISDPRAPAEQLFHQFANVQAAFLDLARTLLDADYAADIWGSFCARAFPSSEGNQA